MKKRPTYQELQNKIKELESQSLLQKPRSKNDQNESVRAQQYQDIAEVMLIAFNEHGEIIFLNRKGYEILGYNERELFGKSWYDTCLPVQVRQEVRQVFDNILAGRLASVEYHENAILTKQGRERFIAWHNTILKNEAGEINGILSSGEDITERKKMEAALRESEERYRRITEAVTDYIFTVHIEEGRVIQTVHGPACLAVTGYTSEELAADPYLWIRMVLVEDHPLVQEQAVLILKGEDPGPIQHRIRRKDGNVRWVNNTPVLHRDFQGRLVAYDGLIRDITERKAIENALRMTQHSVENAPYVIGWVAANGKFDYVNATGCRHFGFSKDEMLSLGIFDIDPDFKKENWPEFWQKIKETKTQVFETHHRTKDGRIIPMEVIVHLMEFEGQEYTLAFGKDITERKQAENQARLQRDLAFALSSTNDLKEALNLLIQTSTKIEGVDCGGVYLIDPVLGNLDLIAHVGLSEAFVKESSYYEADSPHALLINQSVFKKYTEIAPQMDEIRRNEGLRAVAVLPVRAEGNVIALLNLASHTYDEIPPAARATLETLATQVGGAITRLQAQESLRESEEKHRRLYETMPQGVVYQDSEGKIISANAAAEKILGLKLEDMKGRLSTDQCWQSIHEDGSDFPGETHPSMISLQSGQPVKDSIMGLYNPDQKQARWVKIDAIPLFRPGESKPYQVYTMFDDITDRKRAEEESRRRAGEFAALYETANDLAKQQDLPTLLRTIVERAVRLLNATNGEIYLYDETRRDLEIVITTDPRFPLGSHLSMGEGVTGRVAQSREAMIVNDYDTWPYRPAKFEGVPIGAVVEVPMLYRGELIGVLVVHENTDKPREFSQADAHLLSLFAAQAASAVRNARLFQKTQQQAQRQEALYRISISLASLQGVQELCETVVTACREILGYRLFGIFLKDLKTGNRVLQAESGYEGAPKDWVLQPGEGISEKALLTGQLQYWPDVNLEPGYRGRVPGARSEVDVPIKIGDAVLGVLIVEDPRGDGFDAGDFDLLQAVANQIAIALENSRLFLAARQEITERKQAEEALQKSQEKYRNMVENIAEVIWSMDTKGYFTYMSPTVIKALGYQPSEMVGQHFSKLVHEEDLPKVKGRYGRALSTPLEPDEYRLKTKSGDYRWFRFSSQPIFEGERVVGIQGLSTDITAMKHLEGQLRQAQKMEAIGTLAGGIAHDFNNILGIIMGNTELALLDIQEANPAYHNLEEIRKACLRARDVVLQILSFSRQTEAERRPLKLGLLLLESLKLLRSSIPSSINIQQNILSRNDIIMADATQISQVLLNLCANAVHAMRETGGILEISLMDIQIDAESRKRYPDLQPGDYIKLSVSDSGHGIDPAIMDRIFDPYFTTKKIGEGTGLGLAVVHGIVKNHGGVIWVESQSRQGSAFHVLLPSILTEPDSGAPVVTELPKGNERILFVEDERAVAEALKLLLEKLGYSVALKTSSLEALETFRDHPQEFDLVITDQTMPAMTGLSLAKEMLKIRPDLPIILCTGFSEQVNEESAKAIGIKAFIMKPIMMQEMARILRKVLGKGEGVLPFSS